VTSAWRVLGDGKGVKKEEFQTGQKDKFATLHALTVDSKGKPLCPE
jgi:hypothetical protein